MKEKVKKNGVTINNINLLNNTTTIKGDITTESDFRLDGKVDGNIFCGGRLVIGETGSVIGEIKAKNADISGKINGKLFVDELTILRETAVMEGDITTVKITIEPGAIFNGTCNMTKQHAGQQQEKK